MQCRGACVPIGCEVVVQSGRFKFVPATIIAHHHHHYSPQTDPSMPQSTFCLVTWPVTLHPSSSSSLPASPIASVRLSGPVRADRSD